MHSVYLCIVLVLPLGCASVSGYLCAWCVCVVVVRGGGFSIFVRFPFCHSHYAVSFCFVLFFHRRIIHVTFLILAYMHCNSYAMQEMYCSLGI
jgi:hypothetical protein